ncbi:hypothetical protein AKO1_009729 [Acrasis kona]|uniref:Uncharacterized protein n=1 Tax=Acrasis kona TaxID=1008807 RepID=A0AAW2ZQ44_9EUKA
MMTRPSWSMHPLVTLSSSPLDHISDRLNVYNTIINGGRSGMFCGDMDMIFDDFARLAPTSLSSTPRLYNVIYDQYQQQSSSIKNIDSQYKHILGGRIRAMTTGGAPTNQHVIDFLKKIFSCPVYHGYASTECGSIAWMDPSTGTQSIDDVEYELESVPELGYTLSDRPNPRGEIMVKSSQCIPGYYRDEERTKALIRSDGFYRTGDIGEMLPDKSLRIIARRNHVFKLAQGEFVAPESLEIQFGTNPYINQIFIHGETIRSYLVAVVVPHFRMLNSNHAHESPSPSDYNQRAHVYYKMLRSQIEITASQCNLLPYQVPKTFHIESEPFTLQNGLLTGPNKTNRNALVQKYRNVLHQLYENEELYRNVKMVMDGMNQHDDGIIDSLSAARLSRLFNDKLDVRVHVSSLIDRRMDQIMNEIGRPESIPSLPDFNLMTELSNIQDVPIDVPARSLDSQGCILLTGGTGYLGGALVKQLLLRGEKIYVLVRGDHQVEAENRLFSHLIHHVGLSDSIIRSGVQVWRGDLTKPLLGLSLDVMDRINRVYHVGAVVNHARSYSQLKNANVMSCVELLKLCSGRDVSIHYISTMSVTCDEDEDVLHTCATKKMTDGYSCSKLMAELVLNRAKKRGARVSIYRPGLIHMNEDGYCNDQEWITRFMIGVSMMKLAPYGEDRIYMTTVDDVAKCVLSAGDVSEGVRAVHVVNAHHDRDERYITLNRLVGFMKSFGCDISVVTYGEWLRALGQQDHHNPLYPLVHMFTPSFPMVQEEVPSAHNIAIKWQGMNQEWLVHSCCNFIVSKLLNKYTK